MKQTLIILLFATVAFAQRPDSLQRYGEPTYPNTKKFFQHVRLGNHVNDTNQFVWSAFGKIAETETGVPIWGYQQVWKAATAMYYFTATDSAITYYPNFRETEDSDAVFEIRLPVEKGKSWQYKLIDTMITTIVGADETVTVPAGTFQHCIVTEEKEGTDVITRTFAPDLGLIKRVTFGPEFSMTAELLSIKRP